MLSGASSSAPKWSVIDDTGQATACSRGTISRPPPDAAAETTASTRKPREIDGIIATSRPTSSPVWAPGDTAGTTAAATVSRSTARPATRIRRRPLASRAAERNLSSAPRSSRASRMPFRGDPPKRASVEESAVDIRPLLAGELTGVQPGDRGPAAQHQGRRAGLDRQLTQVGRDEDRCAARAGLADHVEGGAHAERVDTVERLVEQQDLRLVEG